MCAPAPIWPVAGACEPAVRAVLAAMDASGSGWRGARPGKAFGPQVRADLAGLGIVQVVEDADGLAQVVERDRGPVCAVQRPAQHVQGLGLAVPVADVAADGEGFLETVERGVDPAQAGLDRAEVVHGPG